MEPNTSNYIDLLPEDLLKYIFRLISSKERSLICSVSKLWNKVLVSMCSPEAYYDYHSFVRSDKEWDLECACCYYDLDLIRESCIRIKLASTKSTHPNNDDRRILWNAMCNVFINRDIRIINYMLHEVNSYPDAIGVVNKWYSCDLGSGVRKAVLKSCVSHDIVLVTSDYDDNIVARMVNDSGVKTYKVNTYNYVLDMIKNNHLGLCPLLLQHISKVPDEVYNYVCKRGYVEIIQKLENRISVTDEMRGEGLCYATEYGNLDIFNYLLPNVYDRDNTHNSNYNHRLSEAFSSLCEGMCDYNEKIHYYKNAYIKMLKIFLSDEISPMIDFEHCFDHCDIHEYSGGKGEYVLKHTPRPIAQHLIRDKFTAACNSSDHSAIVLMDHIEIDKILHENPADRIIVDGFIDLCHGYIDVVPICEKYPFTLCQLYFGLGAMYHGIDDENSERNQKYMKKYINQNRENLQAYIEKTKKERTSRENESKSQI